MGKQDDIVVAIAITVVDMDRSSGISGLFH